MLWPFWVSRLTAVVLSVLYLLSMTEEVVLDWQGPFVVNSDGTLDGACDVPADQSVVYQVYGGHPIYGTGKEPVLLYLGETSNGVIARIAQHSPNWLKENVRLFSKIEHTVLVGSVSDGARDKVERVLIWNACPAYNSKGIASKPNPSIKVVNNGKRGALPDWCTADASSDFGNGHTIKSRPSHKCGCLKC